MARPLPVPEQSRNSTPLPGSLMHWTGPEALAAAGSQDDADDSIHTNGHTAEEDMNHLVDQGSHPGLDDNPGPEELQELDLLRQENAQLRSLCVELEQALEEAAQLNEHQPGDDRSREYELLLEEKTETIRQLHQELQNAQSIVSDLESQLQEALEHRPPDGPTPREEELLALSEELERECRQLQEDEQTLMDQMREMEVSMARERAEMARQRNDLTRLQSEIRHELERLEKSGVAVRKMEELKRQFADATTRRGLAASGPGPPTRPPSNKPPSNKLSSPKKTAAV